MDKRKGVAEADVPGMRFPLRSMLILTTGIALLAATIGPFYRQARPEARMPVLALWVGIIAVVALFGWFEWWRSIRRKVAAGPLHFVLREVNLPRRSIIGILCAWGMLLYSVFGAYAATHMFSSSNFGGGSGGMFLPVVIPGVFIGALVVAAIDYVSRPWAYTGLVEFGELGVIVDRRALPWSRFLHASWHEEYPNRLILRTGKWTYLEVAVPGAIRSEVEAFVGARTNFGAAVEN